MSLAHEPKLLLDLDRTLFDTDAYTSALLQAIAPQLGISPEALIGEVPAHYVMSPQGGGSYYDMNRHLKGHGVGFGDIEETAQNLPDNYLFPDAARLLSALRVGRRDAEVLTHGEQRTQALKLAVCKPLGGMVAHITLMPKGAFIASQWPETTGIIIDDKDILDLPEGWTGVRINRGALVSVQELVGATSFQIASLDYVLPLIDRLYSRPS